MDSFSQLTLSAPLAKAIAELGFEKPSEIQAQALPILLGNPTDFIGLAATGTGKTAAFSIPLLERIDTADKSIQTLILCPTRELALQVAGQIDLLGKYKGVSALAIYGGSSYTEQFRGLKRNPRVVVGTPGRVVDHINRGSLDLSKLKTIILDEADEMISMGFKDDLQAVLDQVPSGESNIWLFSATMSKEVRKVADTYLKNPQQVQINRTEMLPSTIEQLYYITHESNKPDILCKLVDQADGFYGLVFCQTKSLVTDITRYLTDRGYKVDCLHGDKDQNARERTMQLFRDRKVSILVCTDVASRGLDVKDVTHVINYSIPRELDNYVHRIGRTARSGKTGIAMSLVTPATRGLIGRVEKMTKSRMKEGRVPSRKEIGIKKVARILPQFQEQATFTRAIDLLDETWKTAIAEMSREEIVGRFLALTFPAVFSEQETGKMPGAPVKTGQDRNDRRARNREEYGGGARREGRRDDRRENREDRFDRRSEPRTERFDRRSESREDSPQREEKPRREFRDERKPRTEERLGRRAEGFRNEGRKEERSSSGFRKENREERFDKSTSPYKGKPRFSDRRERSENRF